MYTYHFNQGSGTVTSRERRQHPRYRSVTDAFAVLNSELPVLAQLIDISEGGMSVWYVDEQGKSSEAAELDLFLMNSPYRISALPVETTCDFETRQEAGESDRTIRRRCFRFGHLLAVQKNAVAEFITYHTEAATA